MPKVMKKLVILLFALVMGIGSITAGSGVDWSTIGWAGNGTGDPANTENWKMSLPEGLSLVNVQHPVFAEEDGFYFTCPDAAFGELRTDGVKLNYAPQGAGIALYLSNFTLKETQVDIMNMDNNTVRWTLYVYKNDGQEGGTIAVEAVSLPATAATYVGKTVKLTPTFTPANATNKNVTWISGTPAVATVAADGTVSGLAEGSSVITVTTEDGNKTATCTVTVSPAPQYEPSTWEETDENIALGSSTWISAFWGGDKANITDGKVDGTNCQLKVEAPQLVEWVIVDLAGTYDINKVSVTTTGDRKDKRYAIYVAPEQATAPALADGSDALVGQWVLLYETEDDYANVNFNSVTYAVNASKVRYVKYGALERNGHTDIYGTAICEIRVAGTTDDPEVLRPDHLAVTNVPTFMTGRTDNITFAVRNSRDKDLTIDASKVSATSSNTAVATVAVSGTQIAVTGVAAGNATITINYSENNLTVTQDITVGAAITKAPVPDKDAANVLSLYSDAYAAYNFWWDAWGGGNGSTYTIDGDNLWHITNFKYFGSQFTDNTDVSDYDYLHIDIWPATATTIGIVPITQKPEGGNSPERGYTTAELTPFEWNSIDVPMSTLIENGVINLDRLYQIKYNKAIQAVEPFGQTNCDGTVELYFDNIYFWKDTMTPTASMEYQVVGDGSQFQYKITVKNNVEAPTAYSVNLYAPGDKLQGHAETAEGTIDIAFTDGFESGTLWLKSTVTVDGQTINVTPYDKDIEGFKKPLPGGFDMTFTALNAVATSSKTGTLDYKIVPTKDTEVDHYVIFVVTEGDKVVCPETSIAKDALEGTLELTGLVPNKENGLWAKAKAVFNDASESPIFQYPGEAQGWTGLSVTTPADPQSEGLDQKGEVETPVATSWRMRIDDNSGVFTANWFVCPQDAPEQCSNYGIAFTVFSGEGFTEVVAQGDSQNFWWGELGEMSEAAYKLGGATKKELGMLEAGKYMITATFHYAKEEGADLTYVVLPNLYFTTVESTDLAAFMTYEVVGDGSQFQYKVTVKNNVEEPTAYSINLYALGETLQGHAETAEGTIDIAFTDGFTAGTLWLKSTVDVDGKTINIYPYNKDINGFKKPSAGGFDMTFTALNPVATGPYTATLDYEIVPTKADEVDHYVIFVVTEGDKVVCPDAEISKDALTGTLYLSDLAQGKENGLWAKARAVFADGSESAIYQYPGEAQGWTGLSVTTPEDAGAMTVDLKASNPQATGSTTATLDYVLTVKNVQDVDSYHIWVVTNSADGDITVFDDKLFALEGTLDLTNLKPNQLNELWVKWSVIYLNGSESEQLGTYPGPAEGWTGLSVTTQESGIDTISADSDTDVEYYSLQGRRIANPAPGSVVIVRRGTQVSKVLIH